MHCDHPEDAPRSLHGWMGCIGHGDGDGMNHGDGHYHGDGTAWRHGAWAAWGDSAVQGRQGGSTPWQPAWLAGQVLLGQCHRGCKVHRSEMRSCPDRAAQVTRSATALARLGDRAVFTTLGFRNVRDHFLDALKLKVRCIIFDYHTYKTRYYYYYYYYYYYQ
jgi:hypothetical protein